MRAALLALAFSLAVMSGCGGGDTALRPLPELTPQELQYCNGGPIETGGQAFSCHLQLGIVEPLEPDELRECVREHGSTDPKPAGNGLALVAERACAYAAAGYLSP